MGILSLLYVYFMVLGCQGIVPVLAPVNAQVWSNNFIHILQWSSGEVTQPGTVHNVKIGNNQALGINGTSLDVSEYMKDIYRNYEIQLWASFGNSSSSKVRIHFMPYTTTVGPPILSLSGCGDCLNISIDLPNRQDAYDSFYNAINFDIHWKKVDKGRDKKEICHNILTNSQTKRSVPYSYVLRYLEPGQRYCVHAQPSSNSISSSQGSCSCEFTRQIKPKGVAFLAGWVFGSVLVGLCFLSFIFSLVYTGFLCKPNVRLPTALIVLVPGYFISPEQTCISVAEVEYGIQIHKLKVGQEEKEKGNGFCKNSVEDDEDEDNDEGDESHYMDRAVPSEPESTGSARSTSFCEVVENLEECSIKHASTDIKESSQLLMQLRYDRAKGYDQATSLDSVTTNSNPSQEKEGKILGGQMKEEEEEEEHDSENVNLWSVVLKSMQPEEEEANELSEVREPFFPLLLQELQEDSLTASKPQIQSSSELHAAPLFHIQKEPQISQDENDVYDTSVCDHVRSGYMASHTGAIDTEIFSSEDEEEDYTSGYMTR